MDEAQEIQRANQICWLRSYAIRWANHAQQITQAPIRNRVCGTCPFGPKRDTILHPATVAELQARIMAGEIWVCHATTGTAGELLPTTKQCAGQYI
jgi:hypothetical protein